MEHRDEYIMDFTIKEEFDIKQEREDIEGNLGIIDVDQIFKPVSINGEFPDDQTTRNSYIKTESSEEEWQEDCISTCSYDEIKLEPYTIDLKHNSNTEFEPFIDRNLKHNPKTSEVEKKLKVKNRPSAQWKSETCSICGEIFVRRTTFERHLIRHGATQSPFECDVCGVKCKLMKHLIAHIARMHAIPNVRVACNDCGKYYHRDYLATHMSRHTTQHSKPSLECTICGKFFHIRANLTSHKRTHRKKKGQCPVCLKWFNVPDALRVHERVHTGEKVIAANELFDWNVSAKLLLISSHFYVGYAVHDSVVKIPLTLILLFIGRERIFLANSVMQNSKILIV